MAVQLQHKDTQLQQRDTQLQHKDAQLYQKNTQNWEKDAEIQTLRVWIECAIFRGDFVYA